jgi:cis-L-3-hydroxyproline dehydratase
MPPKRNDVSKLCVGYFSSTRYTIYRYYQTFTTDILVRGPATSTANPIDTKTEHTNPAKTVAPILYSNTPLSFWGGIDETTGKIIDTSHPLHGENVHNIILILPSGRGSCTASQVLLELILNDKAPRALILRDRDGLVCVGALIAQSIFSKSVLDILQVSSSERQQVSSVMFDALIQYQPKFGSVAANGTLVVGHTEEQVLEGTKQVRASQESKMDDVADVHHYTQEEKDMLKIASSDAERKAIECLVLYRRIVSPTNPTYVNVEQAHIDGCTYIGPGGLQFVQQLVRDGGQVKIPTTLNSVSTDLENWKHLGIEPTISQQNSIRLANAYVALGCSSQSFTCAPYLLDTAPTLGQHVVWGESNAVVYANSILGAQTEKYADYLDICCALVGKVPAVGVHLPQNRIPTLMLDMEEMRLSTEDPDTFQLLFPVLGHLCGTLSDGRVPLLVGLDRYKEHVTKDHLKAFCAAFGTTAASPLIHIAGITPEALDPADIEAMKIVCHENSKAISMEDLDETYQLLDQQTTKEDSRKVDWIAIGNPHLSLSECDELLKIIENRPLGQRKDDNVKMIACMSRALYERSAAVPRLEDFGITFVRDTCWCMLLHPPMIPSDANATILTNSGKYAHYGPGLTGRQFRLGSMKDCVEAACTGRLSRKSMTTDNVPWRISPIN